MDFDLRYFVELQASRESLKHELEFLEEASNKEIHAIVGIGTDLMVVSALTMAFFFYKSDYVIVFNILKTIGVFASAFTMYFFCLSIHIYWLTRQQIKICKSMLRNLDQHEKNMKMILSQFFRKTPE